MSKSKKPKVHAGVVIAAGVGHAMGVATITVHQPLPTEHPFYRAIGRVVAAWANFEHQLDVTIWELLRWKTTGINTPMIASITSQFIGARPRCNTIISLCKARNLPDKLIKLYNKLVQKTHDPSERRNRFIHDPWYIEKDTRVIAQFRAMPPKDPRYGFCDIGEEEADALITDINSLTETANNLFNEVRASLRSS